MPLSLNEARAASAGLDQSARSRSSSRINNPIISRYTINYVYLQEDIVKPLIQSSSRSWPTHCLFYKTSTGHISKETCTAYSTSDCRTTVALHTSISSPPTYLANCSSLTSAASYASLFCKIRGWSQWRKLESLSSITQTEPLIANFSYSPRDLNGWSMSAILRLFDRKMEARAHNVDGAVLSAGTHMRRRAISGRGTLCHVPENSCYIHAASAVRSMLTPTTSQA